MATKEKSPFPPKLYVTHTAEDGEEWFTACDTRAAHATIGETTKIAVYRLVEEGEVTAKPSYRSTR